MAPFQPESGEPAVYVLDRYDDPGVQFDSLWVSGLTATAWPRPVAVDPLAADRDSTPARACPARHPKRAWPRPAK